MPSPAPLLQSAAPAPQLCSPLRAAPPGGLREGPGSQRGSRTRRGPSAQATGTLGPPALAGRRDDPGPACQRATAPAPRSPWQLPPALPPPRPPTSGSSSSPPPPSPARACAPPPPLRTGLFPPLRFSRTNRGRSEGWGLDGAERGLGTPPACPWKRMNGAGGERVEGVEESEGNNK